MPPQSPCCGPVADPSPFVSPPSESSRHDVSTTGLPAVPDAISEPCTLKYAQPWFSPLINVPAPSVTVTPGGTVNALHPACSTGINVPVHGSAEDTDTTSPLSTTPFMPLPLPELPSNLPRSRFDACTSTALPVALVTVFPVIVGTPTG